MRFGTESYGTYSSEDEIRANWALEKHLKEVFEEGREGYYQVYVTAQRRREVIRFLKARQRFMPCDFEFTLSELKSDFTRYELSIKFIDKSDRSADEEVK